MNCNELKDAEVSALLAMLLNDNKGIEYLTLHDPKAIDRDELRLGEEALSQSLRVRGLSLELVKELGLSADEDMDLLCTACHKVFNSCSTYWSGRALSGNDSHVWLQCDPNDELPDWGPKFEDGADVYMDYALKAYDFEVLDWVIDPLWISCMVLPDPKKKVANVMKSAGFYALQGLLSVRPMSYVELSINEKLTAFINLVQASYGSNPNPRIGRQKAFCDAAGVNEQAVWTMDEESFEKWKEEFIREQKARRDELFLKQLYVIEARQSDFNDGHALLKQYHYNDQMTESELNKLGKSLAEDPRLKRLLHHTLYQMTDFSPAILRIASNGTMFLCD